MIVKDHLNEQLRPFVARDSNGHLSVLLDAISAMYQPLYTLISDDEDAGTIGYSSLLDIERVEDAHVPWLGQFVGVKPLAGLAPDGQRLRVKSTDGWKRGRPSAIIGAAQQHLIGNRTVTLRERYNSNTAVEDAYWLQVITYDAETPNPAQTLEDIKEQLPAGDNATLSLFTGQDWLQVKQTYPTWTAVRDAYGNWQSVRDHIPS